MGEEKNLQEVGSIESVLEEIMVENIENECSEI